MISLIIPFIWRFFPAATYRCTTIVPSPRAGHLFIISSSLDRAPLICNSIVCSKPDPVSQSRAIIIITSLINLINNPPSHFRRQVWRLHGVESVWNPRPAAGIHRSQLQILHSCKPQSALSCIFVFVFCICLYEFVCVCVF